MEETDLVGIILRECDKLSDVLNEHFMGNFASMHNIKSDYNLLNLKQEIISDRAYFLDVKKKYAMHIINEKGLPRDEQLIKGISVKRSDYPSITKEGLQKILDMLISEKISFSDIRKLVSSNRDKITKLAISGDMEIARSVSFTKSLEEYKESGRGRIPSHVMGMLLWNELEYEYFNPGTRGAQFRIKGIDKTIAPSKVIEKLDSCFGPKNNNIVVPFEEEKLPDYYIIDVNYTINFCWNSRVNELLNPILSYVEPESAIKDSVVLF